MPATQPNAIEELIVSNSGLVGASTGCFRAHRGDWSSLVQACADVSTGGIELSALSGDELPALSLFLSEESVPGFGFVTLHGPAKNWDGGPHALAEALVPLSRRVEGVVMHPDTLGEPEAFAILGGQLWLENMDTRKHDGRTVVELQRFFDALPEARFCFDIAHAWLHDPTMRLAHALLDAFGDRLAEVHLSSIEDSGKHIPLQSEALTAFAPVLARCTGVPWVLEAVEDR